MTQLTHLDNGAVVLTEQMPARCGVCVGVWLRAGAAHDPPSAQGLAHLLEHLLFKGTERRSALQLAVLLDEIGADLDATTDHEYVVLHSYLLGDDIAVAADVLCDVCLRSSLRAADLETERQVVLEELAAYEDSPEDVITDAAAAALWAGHPLSRPILGVREAVEQIQRDAVHAFWRSHYRPASFVVSAAGAIEHGTLVRALREHLPEVGGPVPDDTAAPPEPQRARRALQRDTSQTYLCLGSPAASARSQECFADAVLCTALGGCPSSRLFQEIRERRGLAYHVDSFCCTYRDAGAMLVQAGTNAVALPQVLELIRAELAAICRDGFSDDEVRQAREQLMARVRLSTDSSAAAVRRLGLDWLVREEVREPEALIRSLGQVTRQDVVERARKTFANGPWVVAALGPVEEGALI